MSDQSDRLLSQARKQVTTKYYNKHSVRLLLLQFDADISDMISAYLLSKGHKCEILSFQGINFVELCLQYKPDVLFAPIDKLGTGTNSKLSFSEFIGKMRGNPETKDISLFMFASTTDYGGWAIPGNQVEYEFRNDDAYLEMPFDIEHLEFCLNRILIKRAARLFKE
jgi:hypothetical protein